MTVLHLTVRIMEMRFGEGESEGVLYALVGELNGEEITRSDWYECSREQIEEQADKYLAETRRLLDVRGLETHRPQ